MSPARPIWQERFADVCDWDSAIATGTIPDLLSEPVAARPEAAAFDFRGQALSYAVFDALTRGLAAGLIAAGIVPGDRIALLLPNTPWHPVTFFAAARCGATIVHLSALDAPRELEHKLAATRPKLLVSTDLPGFLPNALRLLEAGLVPRLLVGADARWGEGEEPPLPVPERAEIGALDALLETPEPAAWPNVAASDLMLLQFTGGTTGLPKAAMLRHGNLVAAVNIYRRWNDGAPLEPGAQRVLCALPLFHIYALTTVMLRHLRDGNTVLLRQRFEAQAVLADIEIGRATVMPGVPTMWIALLNHPGLAQADLTSLRSCISGGAPMPYEVQTRLEDFLGQRVHGGWGMTELAPAGSRVPSIAATRPGLIGVPLPGITMKIVSLEPERDEFPPGEIGEIAIRGPNVFAGYLDAPQANAEAFHEGWFLTGDLGRMDEDGLFEIVDRRKNMIISGGFNVYPVAIENAIYEHASVQEVVVIGVDDAYRGQSAKAFVKLKAGHGAFTLEALQAFLAERLGRHEMPRALEFRDTLPRSAAGKLLAKALIAEEKQKVSAATDSAA